MRVSVKKEEKGMEDFTFPTFFFLLIAD